MVMDGHIWLWMYVVIEGYGWLWMVMDGYMWLCRIIGCYNLYRVMVNVYVIWDIDNTDLCRFKECCANIYLHPITKYNIL